MRSCWALVALLSWCAGATPLVAGEEAAHSGPRIRVEPASFDFGRALPSRTLQKEFSLRNVGDEDLVIERVTTTCRCTGAIAGETTLKPGRRTTLTVKLQTNQNDRGRLERSVLVISNDPKAPSLEVRVSATVEPAS